MTTDYYWQTNGHHFTNVNGTTRRVSKAVALSLKKLQLNDDDDSVVIIQDRGPFESGATIDHVVASLEWMKNKYKFGHGFKYR